MGTVVLEINDVALNWGRDGRLEASEPGYALADGDSILTGNAAYQQAHLKPRQINNRFWDELTISDNGESPSAELAYAQIEKIWSDLGRSDDRVILVAPPYYDRSQLGLLLGLAQECGMPVAGLVHGSVAAAEQPYPGRQLIHLGGSLHRVTAALIEQGESASVVRAEQLDRVGVADLLDRWAKRVAELFVLTTRFDPLHRAEVEQALHDKLPDWLSQLRTQEAIDIDLENHGLSLGRAQLLSATDGSMAALVQLIGGLREPGMELVLQVDHQLARLPGVLDRLGELEGVTLKALGDEHIVANLDAIKAQLPSPDQGIRLATKLPWQKPPAVTEDQTPPPSPVEATRFDNGVSHVIYRGVGYPIPTEGLMVGREPGPGGLRVADGDTSAGISAVHFELQCRGAETFLRDTSRYGTQVNDRKVAAETRLDAGDVISFGNPPENLLVVRVEDV